MVGQMKHACCCCGYLTLGEAPPGTYEICPVCGWEDDFVQFEDPDIEGGANQVSLNVARAYFKAIGASDRNYLDNVRKPKEDEEP